MWAFQRSTGDSRCMDYFLTAFWANTISRWTHIDSSALSSASRFSRHRPQTERSRSVFSWHSKHLRLKIHIPIASTGHSLTHAPHLMQSPLTFALPTLTFIGSHRTSTFTASAANAFFFVYLCGHKTISLIFLTGHD